MTIPPTIQLEEVSRRRWDALVVGAGPAGALAARELALRGRAVLLVDKASFPRRKVCGGCLNAAALATLEQVGLGGLPQHCRAVPLRRVCFAGRGCRASVPLPGGVALSREALDAALVREALQSGATFLPGTEATLMPAEGSERKLMLHQRDRQGVVNTRLVLAADGLGGRLLAEEEGFRAPIENGSRIGAGVLAELAPAFYSAQTIFMACGRGGYVGLVRLEDGRLNIAAAFDLALVRQHGGPGPAAVAVLDEAGWPAIAKVSALPWRGTAALTRQRARIAGDRVLVLGDAAGYIEPFTGEGMAWALAAGAGVTSLADRAIDRWQPSLGRQWGVLHSEIVGHSQQFCRVVAQVLRHPALARALIVMLGQLPGLATPFVRRLNTLSPRKVIFS